MSFPRNRRLLQIIAALVMLFAMFAVTGSADVITALIPAFTVGALGMVIPAYGLRDAELSASIALPAAPGTVETGGIDLGVNPGSHFKENCELRVTAPALTVAELANASTVVYGLFQAASADFSDEVALNASVLTQTGADGNGAVAAEGRVALPSNVSRYLRAKATTDGEDASAKSVVVDLLF